MPANIPNMENINAVARAEASSPNIFRKGEELHKAVMHKKARKAIQQQRAQAQAKNEYAQGVKQAVQQSQAQQRTQQQQATAAQQAHTAGVKAGTTAPSPGAAPRTFSMPSGPVGQASQAAAKMAQQQRTQAHGQAIQMQNQMNRQAAQTQAQHAKVMKQQINTAHGEALKMQAGMEKAQTTPQKAPRKAAQPLTVTPKSKAYPLHQNPPGSSQQRLNTLSDTETAKTGKPNNFSVGSKKPSKTNTQGLAAMGSKLEAGLASKKFPLPEPRKRV
jgi:hypothetical protein